MFDIDSDPVYKLRKYLGTYLNLTKQVILLIQQEKKSQCYTLMHFCDLVIRCKYQAEKYQ